MSSGFRWLDRVLQVSFEESKMFWVVGIVEDGQDRFYARRGDYETFAINHDYKYVRRYKTEAAAKAQRTRLKKQVSSRFVDTLFIRRYATAEVVVKRGDE